MYQYLFTINFQMNKNMLLYLRKAVLHNGGESALHIGICDDLDADLKILEKYIRQYMNAHSIDCTISTFESGEALLSNLQNEQYDILFLDIYMDGKNGVETARTIRQAGLECMLIFLPPHG